MRRMSLLRRGNMQKAFGFTQDDEDPDLDKHLMSPRKFYRYPGDQDTDYDQSEVDSEVMGEVVLSPNKRKSTS